MAEAVAAFYAVETVAEGAAAGALAVSGSTVPLHARFQKIKAPSNQLRLTESSANIVKNKVYLLGGHATPNRNHAAHGVHILSFPPDFGSSRTETAEPIDVDYELTLPEFVSDTTRPLEKHSDHIVQQSTVARDGSHRASWSRIQHSTVAVNDRIYVLGGLHLSESTIRQSNTNNIIPLDTLLAYDTLKSNYALLHADPEKCTEGLPEARYNASCTSSPYPTLNVPSLEAHGTIFLHGGYDLSGAALHDTWTFDIGTRAWHKFPTIVDTALEDKSVPGAVCYVEHRLWYVNGSTVMHLDLAERDPETVEDSIATQAAAALSTGRVGSGQWQVVYPPAELDSASPVTSTKPQASSKEGEGTPTPAPTTENTPSQFPSQPTSTIHPLTTGSGRTYLLSVPPTNPQHLHLFQIPSTTGTATSIKDMIRDKASAAISSLPKSWRSGKHEWSRIEIVQASMKDGEVERPGERLTGFAVAQGILEGYGDRVVLWGGQDATGSDGGGVKNEGWIVQFS